MKSDITFHIDQAKIDEFNQLVGKYALVYRIEARDSLVRAMKSIYNRGMNYTPPKQRSALIRKIEKDVDKSVTIPSKVVSKTVRDIINQKKSLGMDYINQVFKKSNKLKKFKLVPFDKKFHEERRIPSSDPRRSLRVKRKKDEILVTLDSTGQRNYLRDILNRIGSLKSIWVKPILHLSRLGSSSPYIPEYVKKNYYRYGIHYSDSNIVDSNEQIMVKASLSGPLMIYLNRVLSSSIDHTLNGLRRQISAGLKKFYRR